MIHKGTLVLGTLIGAGIGVLLAPDKGKVTRTQLKDEGKTVKHKLIGDLKDLKEDVTKSAKSGKEKLKHDIEVFRSKTSHKAEKAIIFLEKQLAVLKEKNKTLQTDNNQSV